MSSIKSTLLMAVFFLPIMACSPSRPSIPVTAPTVVETSRGNIQGARFQLAKPRDWNRKILLVAPGWRPSDAKLTASLPINAPFESALLEDGWLVAVTSYHRAGLIVEDGIGDLQKLVRRIEKLYGAADVLVIEGSSMGGAVGVLIAEGDFFPPHLDIGVLAYGVNLEEPGETGPLPLNHRPGHSLLMMSNRSEWTSPLAYVRQSPWGKNRPALWYLDRDGHVNLNSAERLRAVAAMERWIDAGERPKGAPPFGLDVTVDLDNRPSRALEIPGGYRVKVTGVDPIFGNVETDMTVGPMQWMQQQDEEGFHVAYGPTRWIRFGTTYSDVEPGELVAFLTAEGYVRIAKNQGNAAKALGCGEGDFLDCIVRDSQEKEAPDSPRQLHERK